MQAFEVDIGIDAIYLSATQAFLAVLVLAYSLLLGQENFISRSEAMHRNGIELGRFLRTLQPHTTNTTMSISQYNDFVKQYYDILDKYENHKPIDFLYTRLHFRPERLSDWPLYCWIWLKAQFLSLLSFSHYLLVLSFVIFLFYTMFSTIYETSKKSTLIQPADFEGPKESESFEHPAISNKVVLKNQSHYDRLNIQNYMEAKGHTWMN